MSIKPKRFANFHRTISKNEWDGILSQNSTVNLTELKYKRTPESMDLSSSVHEYIMFNRDKTANIDIYGFDQTNYHRTPNGVIVMLKGFGRPVFEDGWSLLATSYAELAARPDSLSLYNSIVPPSEGAMQRLDSGFRASDRITIGPLFPLEEKSREGSTK